MPLKSFLLHPLEKLAGTLSSYFSKKPVSLTKETVEEYNQTRSGFNHRMICYAPFTNLFFGYEGKIGVCCYNRTHLLGTYPETSIRDAWFGSPVSVLRKKIKNVDLLAGCYGCHTQWLEKAYNTVLARNYDHLRTWGKYPKSMEFELSNRCNLNCIMCSEENSSFIAKERLGWDEKLKPYNNDFVHDLEEFIPQLHSAKFLGGEPFLIPIYYKIWDAITRLNPGCEILVQTNGTILNERIKKLLNAGNVALNISIDSLKKESFEMIRVNADFESTFDNLLYFIDFCKKNKRYIGITACFMQQNWQDIPHLIDFCNQHKIPITFNRVWAPPKCAVWGSSSELITEILTFYQKQQFPQASSLESANCNAFNDLISLLQSWKQQAEKQEESERQNMKTPVTILEEQIRERIKQTLRIQNTFPAEENEILSKLDFFFSKYHDHPQYKILLLKTLEMPGEILQSQLMNNSFERLEQQVKDIITQ